jgi:hypothetical protein
MRGGGNTDCSRAAGGGESIPSAGDLDGHTVAGGQGEAADGQRLLLRRAFGARWFPLGLGWIARAGSARKLVRERFTFAHSPARRVGFELAASGLLPEWTSRFEERWQSVDMGFQAIRPQSNAHWHGDQLEPNLRRLEWAQPMVENGRFNVDLGPG